MGTKITIEEWLAELTRVECPIPVKGFSMQDLSKKWNVGRSATQERIHTLIEEGKLEYAGDRTQINISNRKSRIPVYRIVRTKMGEKK